MTREEAIKKLKWFREYNEDDFCGGDRIQDEYGDWYYRITEQDFEAFDMAIKALEQEPTTKNDSKFCPDRKAKTTHMETILHCIENECAAYKDGKCLKYNSDQEPTNKNDLGVEYISRSELMAILSDYYDTTVEYRSMLKEIAALPSVTPQEPRKGHWINTCEYVYRAIDCIECSCCHYKSLEEGNYCPNCGAKMEGGRQWE